MKQKFQQFMTGRYGVDQLSRLLLGISVVFCALSLFSRWNLFYLLALALLGYTYYRKIGRAHV